MSLAHKIAATDAPKGKGSEAVASAAQIQDIAMLKVVERATKGKINPAPYLTVSENDAAAIWLRDQIAKSQSLVTTQVVDLTPVLARVLLSNNPNNRTISEAIVSNYVRDMANDAWHFNGEPVIVSKSGELNDGQHRCMAVILSGATIPIVFIAGVDRETRTTLDQGRTRTTGDYLSMVGHTDTLSLAAAGKMVWQWRKFGLVSHSAKFRPTKGEIMTTVEETPALARSMHAISWNSIAAAGSRSMMAFCHYAFGITAPRAEVDAFVHGLTTGENLAVASPILYVRNRLLSEKSRLKVGERAELIFRGWNAHRRGETPKTLQIVGGELPMVE